MPGNIKNVIAAIDYIESHLHEKLDLDTIAEALHYSKYHLHRMFTGTVDLTIQTYAQRRRLTEAAKLLVFSDKPILEIALTAGYESQQSFTDSFRAMYKKAPNQYREEEEFYPLQLRYVLNKNPANLEGEVCWQQKIAHATEADIPEWMDLFHLVIDGFPHLDEEQYLEQLREYIRNRQALILKDADTAVGIMAFNEMTRSIDFLGVHPQYRKKGIAKAFCEKALHELVCSEAITVTTFREGDKADTGRLSKALVLPKRNCWSSLVTRHSVSYYTNPKAVSAVKYYGKKKRRVQSMNETQAEENPLSQVFDIKSLLKFTFPTIVMMLLRRLFKIDAIGFLNDLTKYKEMA